MTITLATKSNKDGGLFAQLPDETMSACEDSVDTSVSNFSFVEKVGFLMVGLIYYLFIAGLRCKVVNLRPEVTLETVTVKARIPNFLPIDDYFIHCLF